jgi:hypothetical protein
MLATIVELLLPKVAKKEKKEQFQEVQINDLFSVCIGE